MVAHLAEVGLRTRIAQIPGGGFDAEMLRNHMAQDKKVKRGKLTFILVKGIGRAFIANDIAADTVKAFLAESLRQ